jgi:hypothetical protein
MVDYKSLGEAGMGYGKTLNIIGDSISLGTAATAEMYKYPVVISVPTSFTIANKAIAGTCLAQYLPQQICPITVADDTNSLILAGFNDVSAGALPNFASFQANYYNMLLAGLIWLGVVDKITGSDERITENGDWTSTAMYGGAFNSLSTVTNTDSLVVSSVQGTAIYVCYLRWSVTSGKGGTFTVDIDGGTPITVDTTSDLAAFAAPVGDSWLNVIRIAGLSAGSHTVTITAVDAGDEIDIAWIASNYQSNPSTVPTVYAGNIIGRSVAAYENISGNSSWTDALNSASEQAIQELISDGLGVLFADTNSYYHPDDGDEATGTDHPGNLGHCHIAQAFLDLML